MAPDFDLIINGASVIAIIYGLIEALKQAEWLPTKYARLAALFIGMAASVSIGLWPVPMELVVRGLALGVVASTGYAGIKKGAQDTGDSDMFLPYDR